MQTLTKPWNKAPAGTEITDDPAEARKGGKKVVLVDSARLAHLSKHGFFRVRKEVESAEKSTPPMSHASRSGAGTSAGNEAGNVPTDAPEPSSLPAPRTIDPCPICGGVEGCDHTVAERKQAAKGDL